MAKFRDDFKQSLPKPSAVVMSELDLLLETHNLRPPAFWRKEMLARAAAMSKEEFELHKGNILQFYTERQAINPPLPPTWTDEPNQMWKLD